MSLTFSSMITRQFAFAKVLRRFELWSPVGAHEQFAIARAQIAAHILPAAKRVAHRPFKPRSQDQWFGRSCARGLVYGRATKSRVGHDGGNGIARQSDHQRLVDTPDGQRLAGFHGDAPELHFAQFGYHVLDEIRAAHGNTAARHDQIRVSGGVRQRFSNGFAVVGETTQINDVAGFFAEQRGQGEAIGIVYLAHSERLARRCQFIAGGSDGHPHATFDAHRSDTACASQVCVVGRELRVRGAKGGRRWRCRGRDDAHAARNAPARQSTRIRGRWWHLPATTPRPRRSARTAPVRSAPRRLRLRGKWPDDRPGSRRSRETVSRGCCSRPPRTPR